MSHFGWANQNYSDGSRNESANIQIENLDQNLEWVILNDRVYNSTPDKIPIWSEMYSLKWSESNYCEEMKFDSF